MIIGHGIYNQVFRRAGLLRPHGVIHGKEIIGDEKMTGPASFLFGLGRRNGSRRGLEGDGGGQQDPTYTSQSDEPRQSLMQAAVFT